MSAREDSWRFISSVYAAPGVREACLKLQQEFDADVVLLLFAGWLASEGAALSPDDAAAAAMLVRPWRQQAVLPLRTIRTELKTSPAMARPEVASLRDRIKASELAAERIELEMLVEWAQARARSQAAGNLVAGNLAVCLPKSAAMAVAGSEASFRALVAACIARITAGQRSG
ncbi:TIGR02444 family protein (plasmid) [Bosea vestrisii]|uniref:TIGR02444 family protein n=1 Tax=Bosea vestrisii TaxID=151416 RepID=UPI0024E00D2C|nr:TIGR02444 family protein [Bosea vestrisii]WID99805.1 TIGR02444 family protein [Bosea vestrisii]